MEAVFGMLFSVIFMNEILSVKILLGAFLVLLAILINEVSLVKKCYT